MAGMQSLRALVLDYGGVVFHHDPADYDRIGARHGVPAGMLWDGFHSIPEYQASRRGLIPRDEFHRIARERLVDRLGAEVADPALADLAAYYDGQSPVRPVMRELLARLRGVVRLALLSNATRGFTASLQASGTAALFDFVACSGDIGLAKPDPRAYLYVSDALGVAPADCLFVDDTAAYAEAAAATGMAALHYHVDRHAELLVALGAAGIAA